MASQCASEAPAATASSTERPAWRSAWAVTVFVLVTVGALATDLGLKAWSFEHVAGVPVRVDPALSDRPEAYIPPHDRVVLVPHVLSLKLWTNSGAVFGLGKGAQSFFVLVSVVATAVILYLFSRSEARSIGVHALLGLVLAGALGNLYDRIQYNAVRDMLWLFPGVELPFGLHWPGGSSQLYPWIFNVADSALVVGVTGLLLISWFSGQPGQTGRSDRD